MGCLPAGESSTLTKLLWLVVDQFEELITQCRFETVRADFLRQLRGLITENEEVLHVIVTLRTDFESHFTGKESILKELWTETRRFIVPPLSPSELREIILRPAAERGLHFEQEAMVDDLVTSVQQTPGALPLLSFTLSELYRLCYEKKRGDRALREEDYKEIKGVAGALQTRAEQIYGDFPNADEQATFRRIMLRMIALEGDGVTRRRVIDTELKYWDSAETDRANKIVDHLVDARLLVRGVDQNDRTYVEPAHDSLVASWGRLHQWRLNVADYLPLQRRLSQAADDWELAEQAKKAGFLWHDNSRLPAVAELLPTDLNTHIPPVGQIADWVVGRLTSSNVVDRLRVGSASQNQERWLNALETEFTWQSVQRRWRDTHRLWRMIVAAFTTITIVAAIALLANFLRIDANRNLEVANTSLIQTNSELEVANSSLNTANIELEIVNTNLSVANQDLQARLLHAIGREFVDDAPLITLALGIQGIVTATDVTIEQTIAQDLLDTIEAGRTARLTTDTRLIAPVMNDRYLFFDADEGGTDALLDLQQREISFIPLTGAVRRFTRITTYETNAF